MARYEYDSRVPWHVRRAECYDAGRDIQLLTADLDLDIKDAQFQVLDPGGATRVVTLPAEDGQVATDYMVAHQGLWFEIRNVADAAGEDLTIQPVIGGSALPMSTNPSAAQTVTIGTAVFEFRASGATISNDTYIGVLLGSTAAATRANLVSAINGTVASATGILKAGGTAAIYNNSTIPVKAYDDGDYIVIKPAHQVGGCPTANNSLDLSTNPTATNTITIGSEVYEFQTAAASLADDAYIGVLIGATAAATIGSLVDAINGDASDNGIFKTDGVTQCVVNGTQSIAAVALSTTTLWIYVADAVGGSPRTAKTSYACSDSLTAAVDWSAANMNVGPGITLADGVTGGWTNTTFSATETVHTISPNADARIVCVGGRWSVTSAMDTDFGTAGIETDLISESTSGAGVTVDGLLIKDEGIDMSGSAVATGDFDITLKTNLADALSITESAGDIAVFDTTTGARKVDWTETRSTWTNAFTSANDVLHVAATINHATANAEALDISMTQITTTRTSGSVIGILDTLVGKSTDSGGNYYGMSLVATDSGGAGTFTGLLFDAGWDAVMDVASCSTGEADVVLGANLASAFAFRVATTDLLTVVTTTNALELTVAAGLDVDYTVATAIGLIDAAVTVGHASNEISGVNVSTVHSTARTTGTVVNGFKATLDSDAADDAAAVYNGLQLATDGTKGVHNAIYVGANFDALIDVSTAATGEADIVLKDNLASAMAWRVAAVDVLTLVTSTAAYELTIAAGVDVDYPVATAISLADFNATIAHATNTISVVSANNTHSTNRTGASIVNLFNGTIDSDAGDDATVVYNWANAATDGTDGVHTVLYVGAGFDALIDVSSVATGEADIVIKDNVASALSARVATTPVWTLVTSTGLYEEALAAKFNQDYTLIAAGTLSDMALSTSFASGSSVALDVHASQITNKRTGGSLVGIQVDLTGLAADDSAVNCVYDGIVLNGTKAGTNTMTGIKFDAGWDAILDVSAMGTGEADIVLGANLASAMALRIAGVDLLTVVTSTAALELTVAAGIDCDYTVATAIGLIDAACTVGHASNEISAVKAATVHSTNRDNAAVVNGLYVVLDADAGDNAGSVYNGVKLTTDGAGGVNNAIYMGANFDAFADVSTAATGEADFVLKDNVASAMAWRVATTDVLTLVTSTGLYEATLAARFNQDYTLATGVALTDMAAVVTVADGSPVVLNLHGTQTTNKRTGGSLVGAKVDMTGISTDDSAVNCVYDAISLTMNKATGTSNATGIRFDAGWDAVLDLSAMATGEADIVVGANLADALTVRVGATPVISLATTTNAQEVTLSGWLDQDYSLVAAGSLLDTNVTVTHATDTINAASFATTHATARTGAAIVNGVLITLDSDAADDSTVFYNAISVATDGTDGVHTALALGAGFDYCLDLSAIASDEAHIGLRDNLAVALAVTESTNNYFAISTVNNGESETFGNRTTNPDFEFKSNGYMEGVTQGFGTRYELQEHFHQRPAIAADIANTNASKTWEVAGTAAATAGAVFYAGGGIQLTTTATDGDQEIIWPNTTGNNDSQSPWMGTTWDSADELEFRCNIRVTDVTLLRMACGLKLTTTLDTSTDDDQIYFGASEDDHAYGANDNWWVVCSIATNDTQTDTGIAAMAAGDVRFVIRIGSDRTAKCYINGVLVHTTAALTAGVALIPFVGVQTESGPGAAKSMVVRSLSMSKLYST